MFQHKPKASATRLQCVLLSTPCVRFDLLCAVEVAVTQGHSRSQDDREQQTRQIRVRCATAMQQGSAPMVGAGPLRQRAHAMT